MASKQSDVVINFKTLFNGIDKNIDSAKKKLSEFKGSAKESSAELDKTKAKIEKTGKSFLSFGKDTEKAGKSFGGLKSLIARGIGFGALALGIRSVTKSYVEFEQKISDISTLLIGQEEDVEKLKKGILELSEVYPKDANELGAAAYQIVSAGIQGVNNQLEALEESTKLAIGGLGTTEQAVDLVTSSLNAFSSQGLTAAQVSTTLFLAVKNGKTTVAELSQGFGAVAGTVAANNIQFEEFIAQVSALTTVGLPAAQAYTQLRAVIAGLTRDTEDSRAVFDELGAKNLPDLIEKSGGFTEALKLVTEAVDNDQAKLLKLVGSTEALNAIIGLTGPVNVAFTNTLDNMANASGELEAAVEKQNNTLGNQYKILKNQLNAEVLRAGDEIFPKITAAIKEFTGSSEENQIGLSNLQKTVRTLTQVILALFTVIVSSVKIAVEAWNFFVRTLTNGGEVILGVFVGTFEGIKTVALGLFKSLTSIFGFIGDNIQASIENPIGAVKVAFAEMVNFFIRRINSFFDIINKGFDLLPDKVKEALGLDGVEIKLEEIEIDPAAKAGLRDLKDLTDEIKNNTFDFSKSKTAFGIAGESLDEFAASSAESGKNILDSFLDIGDASLLAGKNIGDIFDDQLQEQIKTDTAREKHNEEVKEDEIKRQRALTVATEEELRKRIEAEEGSLSEKEALLRKQLEAQGKTEEEITKVLDFSLDAQRKAVEKSKKDLEDSISYKDQFAEMQDFYENEADNILARGKQREEDALKLRADMILEGKTREEIESAEREFYKVEKEREEERLSEYKKFQDIQTEIIAGQTEFKEEIVKANESISEGKDLSEEQAKAMEEMGKEIEDAFGEYEKGIAKAEDAIDKLDQKQKDLIEGFKEDIQDAFNEINDIEVKASDDLAGIFVDSGEKIKELEAEQKKIKDEKDSAERRLEIEKEIAELKREQEDARTGLDALTSGNGQGVIDALIEDNAKTEAQRVIEAAEAERAIYEEKIRILEALKNGEAINLDEIRDYDNLKLAESELAKIESIETLKQVEIDKIADIEKEFLEYLKVAEAEELASILRRKGAYDSLIANINEAIAKYRELDAINAARTSGQNPLPAIPVFHEGGEVSMPSGEGMAKLANKEFVVKASQAQANLPLLHAINAGQAMSAIAQSAVPQNLASKVSTVNNNTNNTSNMRNDLVNINVQNMNNPQDVFENLNKYRRNQF